MDPKALKGKKLLHSKRGGGEMQENYRKQRETL